MLEDVIDNVSEDDEMFNMWLQILTLDQAYENHMKGYIDMLDVQGEPVATSGKKVHIANENSVPNMIDNVIM